MPLHIINGTTNKPAATAELKTVLTNAQHLNGYLFIGYPILASPEQPLTIDALLISPTTGVVVIDVIEGDDFSGHEERQDALANNIEAKLRLHHSMMDRRSLKIAVHVLSFAPLYTQHSLPRADPDYPITNPNTLLETIGSMRWPSSSPYLYTSALSVLENISSLRRSPTPRAATKSSSRGAILQRLEDTIATLDPNQSKAVIETVDGVQRIRGLAGSGKTIVLALKAAYLHAQHPDWNIAVTFNTRSLKQHFRRLIHNFAITQTNTEPNWSKLHIVNAWGAPGRPERSGIYFEYCMTHNVPYMSFRDARGAFGQEEAFSGACQRALDAAEDHYPQYDAILIDEAQDLPPPFLHLCYSLLTKPKRLIYAYDELQSLSGRSLTSPELLFGSAADGQPLVTFQQHAQPSAAPQQDITLAKCYRNSRPILATAHALASAYTALHPKEKPRASFRCLMIRNYGWTSDTSLRIPPCLSKERISPSSEPTRQAPDSLKTIRHSTTS